MFLMAMRGKMLRFKSEVHSWQDGYWTSRWDIPVEVRTADLFPSIELLCIRFDIAGDAVTGCGFGTPESGPT